MFKKQKEEKNKVGRPKLADSKLKKESIIVSCIVIITAILLTIFGGMELTTMLGSNYSSKLTGNVDTNKLKGASAATKTCDTISATSSCPDGYVKGGGGCYKYTGGRNYTTAGFIWSCPSGYTKSGTTCTKCTYSCPSGKKLNGHNECVSEADSKILRTTKKTTKKKTTKKKTTTKKAVKATPKTTSKTTCKLKSSSVKEKTASLVFECSKNKPSITSKKINNGGKISSASVSGKKVTIKLSNLKAKKSYTVSFKANGTTSSGKITTTSGCDVTLSSRKSTSVKYKLACGYNTKVTSQTITYSDGSKATGLKFGTKLTKKEAKSFSSSITGLNATKKYKLTIKTTDGTYTKSFYPMDEGALKSLPYGKCPVAPTVTGVISSGTTYNTEKVNMSININTLSATEKNNLYVLTKSYNSDRVLTYNIAGKSKTEKIGVYNDAVVRPLIGIWNTKDKATYTKQITTGNLYYIAIYSGSHKCSSNYMVKDGYTLNNHGRKYPLRSYNILTKKGVVRGRMEDTKVTSTDEKVFKVNPKLAENSLKATSQTAKNGSESSKTATITMTNKLGTGSFKIRLVNRYWATAYLLNPLTKKTNGALTSSNMYSGKYNSYGKGKTKDSKGKTVYGTELKTGSSKSVYAMDSGTVTGIRTSIPKNTKDTYKLYVQITSYVSDEKYIHTYANLKSVSVKKGDRVYKGQTIGKTNTNYLYISFNYVNGSSLIGMLPSNFIGKNVSYAGVNSKSLATNCQKYGSKCTSGFSIAKTTTTTKTTTTKPTTKPTSSSSTKTNPTTKEDVTVPQGTCKIEYANRKVGDVDCDGYAKASDALAILHNSTKKVEILKVSRYGLSNQTQLLEIANLDSDNEVRASDALTILRFATNKTNKICNKNNKCNTR